LAHAQLETYPAPVAPYFLSSTGTFFGQTFIAPAGSVFSFGFYFYPPPEDFDLGSTFHAQLYHWGGGAVVGDPLFTSAGFASSQSFTGWMDFATGGISLNPGDSYFAVIASVAAGIYGSTHRTFDASPGNPYVGGGMFLGGSPDPGITAAWLQDANNYANSDFDVSDFDAAFRADFTTVPEPGSVMLLATGFAALIGVGLVRRLNRRHFPRNP
jgi:hypothetical protein